MSKCKIIIFKTPRIYSYGDDYVEYDEDEVRAICDYDDRWEAIDHLLKDDSEYKEHKENHLDIIKSNSIYTRDVYYDEHSEIIILQTCSHHLDNSYYIITGIKIFLPSIFFFIEFIHVPILFTK